MGTQHPVVNGKEFQRMIDENDSIWRSGVRSVLDRAFDLFFYAYIFVTVFLPSGTIYGVNFKLPIYMGLLPLAAFSLFHRKRVTLLKLVLLLGVPMILALWILVATHYGFAFDDARHQYIDIALTLMLCWLVSVFCGNDEGRRLQFLRLVLTAEAAASLLKVSVICYSVLRGVSVVQMVLFLDTIFGVKLMTMDIGTLFGRIQFTSDELIPACIFIILRHRDKLKIGNLRASLTVLLLLISVAFSFSRYFWGFAAVAFVIGLLLGRRDRFQGVLVVVLCLSGLASLPMLKTFYELRFSATLLSESDSQRAEQIPALEDFFQGAPLMGNGLGSYTTKVIRGTSESGSYAYEVQLLALLAQIGLVGMMCFSLLAAYYYRNLWVREQLRISDRLAILVLLIFWIAAGFSNPLLFLPIAGINYAIFAALAGLPKDRLHPKLILGATDGATDHPYLPGAMKRA